MSGECDRCGHHCMDCVCNAPDCTSRALEILSQIDADLWRGYTTQEKKAAEDEIARLTSEVTQLRADDQVIVNEWIRDLAEQEKADG